MNVGNLAVRMGKSDVMSAMASLAKKGEKLRSRGVTLLNIHGAFAVTGALTSHCLTPYTALEDFLFYVLHREIP